MTYLGTRPILQDELLKYELHHRARIAIKPGITGMWQVSGRSDITDFEEVVRLDKQYVKSVRCLNRAYRLGQDHAVLESLGCAYHLLAIHDALRADNTIEIEKVDRSSLYKARECFLILLDNPM